MNMATQEDFDFESFKKEAIGGLYAGKKMTGTDGVLTPMMKHFLELMMSGELEYYNTPHFRDQKSGYLS
jgi:hypothetical protein